jgi:hypothetical protein
LKCRYRKWSRIGHLDICNPNYGQKKGRESNLRVQDVVGKISTRATTLVKTSSRSDPAVGSYELWKSRDSNRDSFRTISGLQLGSPRKKSHLDVALVGWRREYYMGEGGGFPRVQAVVCLMVQSAHGLTQHPRVSRNVN